MFITGGVPFNLARNPYYQESYNFITNNKLGGYVPPGYNALRTTCLAKERTTCLTIATNGWFDPQRRPILNFMAVTESGPMFLKAINTKGETKSKEYIHEKMKEVFEEIGYENVVQVITDNASNVRGAGLMIQAKYKNIYWTPCIMHCLNLVSKEICEPKTNDIDEYEVLLFIKEVSDLASFVKNFIMNHGMRLSMLNESKLKFLQIAETRFASVVIMLKRFLLIKNALTQMVVHANWATYKEDDPIIAQRVKELILSVVWWGKIAYIVSFTSPIYAMIRLTDTDKPSLHLVYEMWDNMIEMVKVPIYRFKKELREDCALYIIVKKLLKHWEKSNTSLICLAHSCNPRYYSPNWVGAVRGRVTPIDDNEILQMRNKCFLMFFPDPNNYKTVKKEFADFALMMNAFQDADSIEDTNDFEPKQWCGTHGGSTKFLKSLALKLLGQPSSSPCCERNWSTYSFIHS
uniref:DUF659 domain-containing protein n=1 Tax=Triticum urartu TaxID=4572 RepID=A0A8R7PE57_TRIUA